MKIILSLLGTLNLLIGTVSQLNACNNSLGNWVYPNPKPNPDDQSELKKYYLDINYKMIDLIGISDGIYNLTDEDKKYGLDTAMLATLETEYAEILFDIFSIIKFNDQNYKTDKEMLDIFSFIKNDTNKILINGKDNDEKYNTSFIKIDFISSVLSKVDEWIVDLVNLHNKPYDLINNIIELIFGNNSTGILFLYNDAIKNMLLTNDKELNSFIQADFNEITDQIRSKKDDLKNWLIEH